MFDTPPWLWGLVTLAIPLALHLWSRRPRRIIRVGTLRHLADLPEARSRSSRLTEPLLLALRLAVLTTVVMGLAGLRLSARRLAGPAARLLLVDPELLADSGRVAAEPLLDSLIAVRATVRLLAPGLPERQLPMEPGERLATHAPLWDLLAQADGLVQPGATLEIIALPRLTALGGKRPRLAAKTTWHIPQPAEARWGLADAWMTPHDSVAALLVHGNARGAQFHLLRAANRPGVIPGSDTPALDLAPAADGTNRLELLGTGPFGGRRRTVSSAVIHRIGIAGTADSTVLRRLAAAILAVADELGQTVSLIGNHDSADAIVALTATSPQPAPPLGIFMIPVAVDEAWSGALADSIWARWPWPSSGADQGDPRLAGISQATPETTSERSASPESPNLRIPLLLIAISLLLLERVLAGRRRRISA